MSPTQQPRTGGPRLLSWQMFAFLTIASTGSIAQLPALAEYGLGAVTLYLIPAVLFLIPVALVAAELATTWEGGVFGWVRQGLGERLGFQAIWLQWIQSVALYPSLLSFAAASLAYALGRPDLATNGVYTGSVILVIFWSATLIALRGVSSMAKLSSGGVIVGTLIPATALIVLMVVWLSSGKPSAAPLHASDVVPPFTGIASIVLIISSFIAFAGLEVNAVHIRDMRPPIRSYAKAISVAVLAILLMYIPGTIAISVVVPASSIDLNGGAAQAFIGFSDGLGAPLLGRILAALLVVGALAASISWVSGPSRGLFLVGRQGLLPPMLQKQNRAGVQAPILLVQGVIVTILALAFVVSSSVSKAFWMLQATTAILYMAMYVMLFLTAWRLRRLQPDRSRGFRLKALPVVATVGGVAAMSAIIIGFVPPEQFGANRPLLYTLTIVLGVIVLALPAQLIYRLRSPKWVPEDVVGEGDDMVPGVVQHSDG